MRVRGEGVLLLTGTLQKFPAFFERYMLRKFSYYHALIWGALLPSL